jgi:hypothetical protein
MRAGDGWIVVKNWDRFQHYKNRNPPWIKLYTDIGADEELAALPLAAQGLLMRIWCEYARHNCMLSVRVLRQNVMTFSRPRTFYAHIELLNHAGFIDILASKPLAPEKRREEKRIALARKSQKVLEPIAVDEAMIALARAAQIKMRQQ